MSIRTSAHDTYITVPREPVVARHVELLRLQSSSQKQTSQRYWHMCSTAALVRIQSQEGDLPSLPHWLERTPLKHSVREKKNTLMQTCLILKQNPIAHTEQKCIKSCDIFRWQMGTKPRCKPKPSEQRPWQRGCAEPLAQGQRPLQVKNNNKIRQNTVILYYLHHVNKTYISTPTSTCVPELLARYKL